MPPYFRQHYRAACGLAVLRMVLASYGVQVSEQELLSKVEPDYGREFSNIWNPTLAKIACEYGVAATMYALWPLFKKPLLRRALKEFARDPECLNISKYENPNDKDDPTPEPLPLAYKEMFKAVELGCLGVYGTLTLRRIRSQLAKGRLILATIRLKDMYPDKKVKGFHIILLYKVEGGRITYHDPYYGSALSCTYEHLQKATTDVGAAIVFSGKRS